MRLLPLKSVKVVNWTKCVIFQFDKTDETLRKTPALGLESLPTASKIRKDEVCERMFLDANALSTQDMVWLIVIATSRIQVKEI